MLYGRISAGGMKYYDEKLLRGLETIVEKYGGHSEEKGNKKT